MTNLYSVTTKNPTIKMHISVITNPSYDMESENKTMGKEHLFQDECWIYPSGHHWMYVLAKENWQRN